MAKYEIKDGVGIIPEGTTCIEENGFLNCAELTSIVIPDSVTEIEDSAFGGCTGLTSIVIPGNVEKIGCWVFQGCTGLESMVVSEGNKTYDSRNNCNAIIETEGNLLLAGCKNTVIPDTVTTIGVDSNMRGVSPAFKHCKGLTDIVLPESVTEIGRRSFEGCTELKTVVIKGKLKKIPEEAFKDCTALESITLPAGIGKIDMLAFKGCTALKTINVPAKKGDYYRQRLEGCQQFLKGSGKPLRGTLDELVVELSAEKKAK